MGLFDRYFSARREEIALHMRYVGDIPWTGLLLNPTRLRGSDFLMRWSQGVWSERRVRDAI